MTATIDTIGPGRGRAGETLSINGEGFGAYGTNAVRVDDGGGFTTVPGSDVTTIDSTRVDFVMPAGLARDRFITVEVTNNENNTAALWYFYSQLTLTELETNRLPGKKPGHYESTLTVAGVPDEAPLVQEAKDWDRLASKAELVQHDLLTTLGDLAARGSAGMRRIPIGADGQRYFRDEASGGQWRSLEVEPLWWGKSIPAATLSEVFLVAHGDGGVGPGIGGEDIL